MKLDAIDRRLLNILQKDSSIGIKSLCEQLSMTKTPIYDRIRRLESEGVLSKYVAVLNRDVVKSGMVVFCSVSLESQKIAAIEQFGKEVSELPEVLECYLMGGASDFLLKVVVEDLNDYHRFSSGKLAGLANVAQIKSTFVLKEIKRSTVYPVLS